MDEVVDLLVNEPVPLGISETPINQIRYVFEIEDVDTIEAFPIIPLKTLRSAISNPASFRRDCPELKMVTPDGTLLPAHIPILSDLQKLPDVARVFFSWYLSHMNNTDSLDVVPPFLEDLIDPPQPLPTEITFFNIEYDPIVIDVESYTISVQVITTIKEEYRLHFVMTSLPSPTVENANQTRLIVGPMLSEPFTSKQPVQTGTTILSWNVRGLAQLSITSKIYQLTTQHDPDLLVLSETRLSTDNSREIIVALPFDKSCVLDPAGSSGGVVLLWKAATISLPNLFAQQYLINGSIQGPDL